MEVARRYGFGFIEVPRGSGRSPKFANIVPPYGAAEYANGRSVFVDTFGFECLVCFVILVLLHLWSVVRFLLRCVFADNAWLIFFGVVLWLRQC